MRRGRLAAGLIGGGLVAGAVAARYARSAMQREYRRDDEAAGHAFDELADLAHRTVPTYDGGEVHLVERGRSDGRPLVFVHGVTLASDVWKYQLRDLADEFRVIAIDQRGHGRSTAGTDGYGLDKLGRDLVAVLETLDLSDAVLIGHSMGGFAVQQLLTAHPDVAAGRVAGVVLTNTAAVGMGSRPAWMLPVAQRVIAATPRLPRPQTPNRHVVYLGSRYTFGLAPSPTHVRLIGDLGASLPPEILSPTILAFLDMDLRQALRSVEVPALVVAGSHDRLTPVSAAREIAANLPGAKLVVLDGAGHEIMLERHQRLNELIREFATGLGSQAAPEIGRALGRLA